jgi:hypothetical protein
MKIRLKEFLIDESARLGITQSGVHANIMRGNYKGLRRVWVSRWMVFVTNPGQYIPKKQQIDGTRSKFGINWKQLGHAAGMRQWRIKTGRTKRHQIKYRKQTT